MWGVGNEQPQSRTVSAQPGDAKRVSQLQCQKGHPDSISGLPGDQPTVSETSKGLLRRASKPQGRNGEDGQV